MNTSTRAALAGLIFSAPLVSQAATIHFTATLSGDQEFPIANGSTAMGVASGTLDTLTNVFSWNVTVLAAHPLTGGPALAGHFHGNTDSPPNHTNDVRGVVLEFMGDTVDPDVIKIDNLKGFSSGSFFGLVDLDLVPSALANIAGLLSSQWYVNIHNVEFPGGEIRGQFVTATLVPIPLPAAVWLLGSALIGTASLGRRRSID